MTERPWQPWERNFSGGRIGVQQQQGANEDWLILHVESGGAKTTTSLRLHEAWELARLVSPQLEAERMHIFHEFRAQRDALYAFEWMGNEADLLRRIADEWDCGDGCDYASSASCPRNDRDGCKLADVDAIRSLAAAIDRAVAIRAQAIEARRAETVGLGRNDESAVDEADASTPCSPSPRTGDSDG
jgi:hypothetical protein